MNKILASFLLLFAFTSAYAKEPKVEEVLHVKTLSLSTATDWCGGEQALSGVEKIETGLNSHRLKPSLSRYAKIYTGCVCAKTHRHFRFGEKEKSCPTPPTEAEICGLIVDSMPAKTITEVSGLLNFIRPLSLPLVPVRNLPIPIAPLESITVDALGLKSSDFVYTELEKKKVIEELPKMDLSTCQWSCGNTATDHAFIFSMANIVAASKKMQKGPHPKILKLNFKTDNYGDSADLAKVLTDLEATTKHDVFSKLLPEGFQENYDWFKKNIVPHMSLQYVKDLKTVPGSPHFAYEYDFE